MKHPLLYKTLAIALLMLLLLIPLGMIRSSIDERQHYSETVAQEIARSSSDAQTLTGPVLVVPYTKTEKYWALNEQNESVWRKREVSGELYFLPELLQVNSEMSTELRQRGIYKVNLYHADTRIEGQFRIPADWGLGNALADYQLQPAYLAMGISDIRGIKNSLKLHWDEVEQEVDPGSQVKILGEGVHSKLPAITLDKTIAFRLDILLQGTGKFSLVPVGKETRFNLVSAWPHPSFIGDFLPTDRHIHAQGFSAQWQTSYFSTNMAEHFSRCTQHKDCQGFERTRFGVSLIDPVNHYVKSDRAIKYALLFIVLTFAGFFLFEVMKRLQVHPVQYALVGLALAFFYLLLLSLSEHLDFGWAYLLSAAACVGLIGFYVCFVLHSIWRGLGFTSGLATLYALLYGLLSAEDYALLMGSLLLFGLLAGFMALTRRVNWYAVGMGNNKAQGGE